MPDNLTIDDLLICLVEECSEVIHAATKCLRFGFDRTHPGYGHNREVLAREVGDLLGVIDELPLTLETITQNRIGKLKKIVRSKALREPLADMGPARKT